MLPLLTSHLYEADPVRIQPVGPNKFAPGIDHFGTLQLLHDCQWLQDTKFSNSGGPFQSYVPMIFFKDRLFYKVVPLEVFRW